MIPSPADSALFDELPVAGLVLDGTGRVVRCNRRAAELLGLADLDRMPAITLSSVAFASGDELLDILREGIPVEALAATVSAGSNGPKVDVTASATWIADGALGGAVVCLKQRPAATPGAHDAAFLTAVLETTPDCVLLVTADGLIARLNPAGLRMLEGRDTAELTRLRFIDFVAPQHRPGWERTHQQVCAGESRTWSFDLTALHGTLRRTEAHSMPLHMPDGRGAHLCIMRDVTVRKSQEDALLDRERWFRGLLEALPVAVYTTDAEGRISFYNSAAADMWGQRPELYESLWCGSWKLYSPEGDPLPHQQCPMAIALREERPIRDVEAVLERPDGSRVPFLPFPTPLYDAQGEMVGAVNMMFDISRHKQAGERQQTLINELNHRVKNTLATVQSIATHTFRGRVEASAQRQFESRLIALSTAHDVLSAEGWRQARLEQILRQALVSVSEGVRKRLQLLGPEVSLPPKMALSLALAFHEIADNAVRHGSLSTPLGSARVVWQLISGAGGRRLRLRWAERGTPAVAPPRRRGFGSSIIEEALAHEFGAQISIDHSDTGFVCDIDVPLPEPRASNDPHAPE